MSERIRRSSPAAMMMGPIELDIELIRQRKSSLIRIRGKAMSRKEVKEALQALIALVKRHEGEWPKDRLVAEFQVRSGYTRKKVEDYLSLLEATGQIESREMSVYIKKAERQAEEEKE